MKLFLSSITSIALICGVYLYTFGIPSFLDFGSTPTQAVENQAAGARNGRSGGRRGGGATVVSIGAVENKPYVDILRAVGTSSAIESVDVVAEVSGKVVTTQLEANKKVIVGDPLLQLENTAEKIDLDIANASLKNAQDQVNRYASLNAAGNASVSQVTIQDAQAALVQALLSVDLAKVNLDKKAIGAPISGTLGLSNINRGAYVSAGTTIATIYNIDDLLIEFELPERALGLLARESEVLLSTPAILGKVFKGNIHAFDARVDSTTRTVTVQAKLENEDRQLWPGMSFGVRLINESESGSVVPTNAITWTRNGSQIWVVKEGKAQSMPASILMRQGDEIWIDAKLENGTAVVIEGAHKLRNGSAVQTPQGADGDGGPKKGTKQNGGKPGPVAAVNGETGATQ